MKKPELLAPAGDLERLKIALMYGADAVYIGGKQFSLRSRASNFSLSEIREGVDFAHARSKKVFVTVNMVLHDEDMPGLEEYLKELETIGVDGVIASSPVVVDRAFAHPKLAFHLSTQQSVANSALVRFWADLGVRRVVLARETTISEIRQIQENSPIELEVFVHGGMCSSYSGRCTLSNDMTDRDANRGGCAHSCRWSYDLYRSGKKLSRGFDFTMGAKDLQAIRFVPELMSMGVASLKIEGRMKSPHYIATVVSVYRRVIDDALLGSLRPWNEYEIALGQAENRKTGPGFFPGVPGWDQQFFGEEASNPSQLFAGIVAGYDETAQVATIHQRNLFSVGDALEHFAPGKPPKTFVLQALFDAEGMPIECANHAKQVVRIAVPWAMNPYDMIRKVETKCPDR